MPGPVTVRDKFTELLFGKIGQGDPGPFDIYLEGKGQLCCTAGKYADPRDAVFGDESNRERRKPCNADTCGDPLLSAIVLGYVRNMYT